MYRPRETDQVCTSYEVLRTEYYFWCGTGCLGSNEFSVGFLPLFDHIPFSLTQHKHTHARARTHRSPQPIIVTHQTLSPHILKNQDTAQQQQQQQQQKNTIATYIYIIHVRLSFALHLHWLLILSSPICLNLLFFQATSNDCSRPRHTHVKTTIYIAYYCGLCRV